MNPQVVTPSSLARLTPLDGLGAEGVRQAASLARLESVPPSLHTQDYPWGDKIAYLLQGQIMLDYPGKGRRVIVGGEQDASLPLGRSGSDPIRWRTITAVELVWFDENALDILVTWDQVVPQRSVKRNEGGSADPDGAAAEWRTMPGIFDARKLTLGSFASLPPAHIESLLASFRRQSVRAGEVIVRQNDPGDRYYLIERGRALVTREVAGDSMELAEIEAGDAFGEEALIAETARNATVTMKTAGVLLCLDGEDFVRLLREPLLHYIDAEEAQRRIAAGAQWLDVRFPAEYQSDGLPGALNIPLNALRDALPSLSGNREYIIYCQTGRRSSAAAFLLSQRGLRASLLKGGLKQMFAMENKTA